MCLLLTLFIIDGFLGPKWCYPDSYDNNAMSWWIVLPTGKSLPFTKRAVLVRKNCCLPCGRAPCRTCGSVWGGRLSWVIWAIRDNTILGFWQEHMQQRPPWGEGASAVGATVTVATLFMLSVQARGHLRRETAWVILNFWLSVPPTGCILSGGGGGGQWCGTSRRYTVCPHAICTSLILEVLWLSLMSWFCCL